MPQFWYMAGFPCSWVYKCRLCPSMSANKTKCINKYAWVSASGYSDNHIIIQTSILILILYLDCAAIIKCRRNFLHSSTPLLKDLLSVTSIQVQAPIHSELKLSRVNGDSWLRANYYWEWVPISKAIILFRGPVVHPKSILLRRTGSHLRSRMLWKGRIQPHCQYFTMILLEMVMTKVSFINHQES